MLQKEQILKRDFRAIARLISLVENQDQAGLAMADELYLHTGQARIVGVTGLPGCGKSTLVNQLVQRLVAAGKTIGIVAIDPTSPFSGGAVLGDRVRFKQQDYGEQVFFRSMASRGHQGGISHATSDIVCILDAAGFDYVIIETVGAGQLEIDIAYLVDTLINITTPEAGDDIQAIKAGIMEIGDIFVINKSDLQGADRKFAQLSIMLQDYHPLCQSRPVATADISPFQHGGQVSGGDGGGIPVVKTNAETGEGVDELVGKIYEHAGPVSKRDDGERIKKELAAELLCQLQREIAGRISDDWFEQAVVKIRNKQASPREIVKAQIWEIIQDK